MSTIDTSVSYAFRSSDGKLAAARLCNILERPSDNVSLQTVFILTAYEMIEVCSTKFTLAEALLISGRMNLTNEIICNQIY